MENEADVGLADWERGEIEAAIEELDAGQGVSHEEVVAWLKSWGTAEEKNAPRFS